MPLFGKVLAGGTIVADLPEGGPRSGAPSANSLVSQTNHFRLVMFRTARFLLVMFLTLDQATVIVGSSRQVADD